MLCQHCNKNEATTHIKRSINGQREEMHLCSECAAELGVMEEFRMPSMNEFFGDSFLGNFLGAGVAAMNSLAGVDRCKTCGSSFNDIVKSGRIGCSDCYEKFMFGTDWPLANYSDYIEFTKWLIPEEHWEHVFCKNAETIYKLNF
mgnify:CR=1 FL=1